jgi:hypothetical protein
MKRIFLLAVMGCYLAFAYLLYHRWLVTEAAYGGPIEFAQLLGGNHDPGIYCERDATTVVQTPLLSAVWLSSSYPDSAPKQFSPCLLAQRMSWFSVLIPLWVADVLTLSAHAALVLMQHTTRPPEQAYNARLEHANGFCHAVLYALFKVLLLGRLSSPSSPALSWYLIFAPIYAAAVLQAILHSFKTLEGGEALFRGRDSSRPRRRPGFFLTLDDTLAFNISLHLSGSFYVRNATWSVVFWPLWLVAAVCGVGLFLLICFGVPMLSRRYPTRQFLMVLPPLLLLLATYSLSMLALTKGIEWLDFPQSPVRAAEVMSPAIAAAWCLWLLLAVVTLSALWHVSGPSGDGDDDRPREQPTWESLSTQMPELLVRESSTLFRQVRGLTSPTSPPSSLLPLPSLLSPPPTSTCLRQPTPPLAPSPPLPADLNARLGPSQVSARTLSAYNSRYRRFDEESAGTEGLDLDDGRGTPSKSASRSAADAAAATDERGSTSSTRADTSDLLDGAGCWICLRDDVSADAVLLPCGHGGICLDCATNLWKRRSLCPLCRGPIDLFATVNDGVHVDDKLVVKPKLPQQPLDSP